MSSDGHNEVTFDAIRQFVIVPDRRYRVEPRDGSLHFQRTGSQFDSQWLVRGARSVLGDRIADAFERASRSRLILGGIGVSTVSALVLVGAFAFSSSAPFRRSDLTGMGVLIFAFTVGLIMITAGIATRRKGASHSRHDFSLPVSEIVEAMLLSPQSEIARRGEPQVARVHLEATSGSTIRLGIPTESDLETVKSAIPRLAA